MTTQHTRRTDAAARGAELKQLRAAGLSGRDGLAGADGGDVHMSWWAQPHARAGGRSWGPGGIQRAQSGTVVAARCHQSSEAAAQPGSSPHQLAGREHMRTCGELAAAWRDERDRPGTACARMREARLPNRARLLDGGPYHRSPPSAPRESSAPPSIRTPSGSRTTSWCDAQGLQLGCHHASTQLLAGSLPPRPQSCRASAHRRRGSSTGAHQLRAHGDTTVRRR